VLTGASQDYAVVAQKSGHPNLRNSLQVLFDQAFGISGHALLERHREQANDFRFKLEQSISKTEVLTPQLKAQLNRLEMQFQTSHQRVYKGVMGWLLLQLLRVAEQGLWVRLLALLRKVLRVVTSPLFKFVNARPHLKMRLIGMSQQVGLAPFLKRIWTSLQNQELENSDSKTQAPIAVESMSQSAQRIAQTLQNKKKM
jgi:hypothetical protein